ncbi:MAG: S-layer homology domain-containing protein [Clostridia bacterium]|nr:S-layer homology domain-containing protein [Clostridia bacterium]
MKKIISIVLALMMVLSMFTAVSAAPVSDYIDAGGYTNPLPLSLTVEVAAGRNGSGTYAAEDLAIISSGAEGVDYKTTLNMGPIRQLFSANTIRAAFGDNAVARGEFRGATATTAVDVIIAYPAGASFALPITANTTGALTSGAAFTEVSRTEPEANKLKISFSGTHTVGTLADNVDTLLADITFTLNDVVSYASAGTYPVTVTLEGYTDIAFSSYAPGTFKVNYSGTDTHNTVYTAYVAPTPGGSSAPSSYTVTFNTNGGSEVAPVKVKRGDKLTAPEVTKEGYVFDEWYTDAEFTMPFDFNTAITKNITLFAKWTEEIKPGVPTAPADFDKFTDLGGYEWAETAINYLAYKDIVKGVTDTTYAPDMGVKRGDVALLMVRIFGLESDATEEFDDIEVDYYRDACRIGKDHGVLLGVNEDNTLYEPERIILREEMAALIVRSLVTMGHIDAPTDTDISMYKDADDTEAYAVPYIAYLTRMGIVQGNPDGTFRPKDEINRAEAAQILYNLYKLDIEGLLD